LFFFFFFLIDAPGRVFLLLSAPWFNKKRREHRPLRQAESRTLEELSHPGAFSSDNRAFSSGERTSPIGVPFPRRRSLAMFGSEPVAPPPSSDVAAVAKVSPGILEGV